MYIQKNSHALPTRAQGFTLIELIMVMIVAIVMIGIGVPGFRDAIAKYRMESASRSLADDLLLAREESRDGVSAVTICASSNGTSCNSSDWAGGHIVFRDPANPGQLDAGEVVVRIGEKAKSGISIAVKQVGDASAFTRGYLIFDEGRLDVNSLQFTTCQKTHIPHLTTVGRNGYITSAKGATVCS